MCFKRGVLEMIYDILHVKEQQCLGKEHCAHWYLYTFPDQLSGQGDFGRKRLQREQPVQLGPTTFCACQK